MRFFKLNSDSYAHQSIFPDAPILNICSNQVQSSHAVCDRSAYVRKKRVARLIPGLYGEAWFDEERQSRRLRLTSEGRGKVAEYLTRYPHPVALLISMWP